MYWCRWPELRYASRTLLKRPAAALAVVAILASAIAVAAVLGALFAAILHDVPPIGSPGEVGRVWFADDRRPAGHREASFADFLAWNEAALTLTDLTAFTIEERLLGDSDGLRVRAMSVTPEYFQLTGRVPLLGRPFEARDGDAGGRIIVSDRLWRTRFNSDPNIVGRSVRLDVELREIVNASVPPAGDRTLVAPLTTKYDLPPSVRADPLQRVVDEASDATARLTRPSRWSRRGGSRPRGRAGPRLPHIRPRPSEGVRPPA